MRIVALAALAIASAWEPVRPGVWHRVAPMSTAGALASVHVVAVRIDPKLVRFSLADAMREDGPGNVWTVDSIGDAGVVAFNAGQFSAGGAWGWVVRDGVEERLPGSGSVAMAFVIDSAGVPALLEPGEIEARRGHVSLAFQSYPALLVGNGQVPHELQADGRGVSLTHRDSRLALCMLRDGTIVVALTRVAGLGATLETLPWGPTVVEMADYMRSLGCRRAMLLDGGISGQLALRAANGTLRRWPNWRAVPLGLVVMPAAGH
jgi:exopolysaccharide biosynthesis protein